MYLDLLFCLCLLVNYFLLLVTAKLFRRRAVFTRLLAASAAGALPVILLVLPQSPLVNITAIIGAPLLMILIAFRPARPLEILLLWAAFFMIAFMTGGALLAFTAGSDAVFSSFRGIALLLGVCLALYIMFSMVRPYHEERKWQRIWRMELLVSWRGKEIGVPAYLDTGNRLRDPFSSLPVIVIDYRSLEGMLPSSVYCSLADSAGKPWLAIRNIDDYALSRCFTLLPCRGFGGGGEILLGFIPDTVVITRGEQQWKHGTGVVLGLTRRGFGPVSEYRALLPPEVVGAA